jgi:hypothetical protein
VGGDVTYFVSRVVAVGGLVRLTRGTVELPNTLGPGRAALTAGGTQISGGLRRW